MKKKALKKNRAARKKSKKKRVLEKKTSFPKKKLGLFIRKIKSFKKKISLHAQKKAKKTRFGKKDVFSQKIFKKKHGGRRGAARPFVENDF